MMNSSRNQLQGCARQHKGSGMGLQENKSNLAGFSISTRFPKEPWREWGHRAPSSVSERWMGLIFFHDSSP